MTTFNRQSTIDNRQSASSSVPSCLRASVPSAASLLPLARQHFGVSAFRPLQRDAIDADLRGRDSLVVMPTGGGKSLCYQLPSIAVARALTLVVSPLIALMKDQVDRLRSCHPERSEGSRFGVSAFQRFGVSAAAFLTSEQNFHEQRDILRMAREGHLRLLYVSPERCMQPEFLYHLAPCNVRSIVIDEAHCIASWGHDFRPAYAALGDLRKMFPGVAVHAFTATATERVRTQIIDSLSLRVAQPPSAVVPPCATVVSEPRPSGSGPCASSVPSCLRASVPGTEGPILIGDFDRPNLTLTVCDSPARTRDIDLSSWMTVIWAKHHSAERLHVDGIVYCNTRLETERIAALLTERCNRDARPYHAGLSDELRRSVQEWFMQPVILSEAKDLNASMPNASMPAPKIVVATIAFGMGIDKPDVRFVIHYGMPSSLEVYHQEIGRAGRDGLPAECVMLYDRSDYFRWLELFESCHPEQSEGSLDGKLDALSDMECYCGVHMVSAARSRCRHAHLVQHFGQEYVAPLPSVPSCLSASVPSSSGCGACDVCLTAPPAPVRAARRKPAEVSPPPRSGNDVPLEVLA